ncbi:MAG: putative N-glycosylase/DNA lyase [Parcubacteria group bacterium GW2011_GWA2_31_28]|nr:MAG: putative N-glycosylase/DNA lyase [Parcubacteria group bacterium GW2011_GWA2_31_28]
MELKKILRDKTRFYKNKSNYLKLSKDQYNNIKKIIINKNKKDIIKNKKIREFLVKNIKGLGYKEASHFLRNIGYKNLAILDRHILKNLQKFKVINKVPKHLNKKNYLSIEEKFYKFSKKIDIPMDELDLLFWSMETGKVFK